MGVKWEYDTHEFETDASQRAATLAAYLNERGAQGWELIRMDNPMTHTRSDIHIERRLLVFKRTKSGTLTG